jgi:uncharacterized repeat protein (TIGR01451 family)
VYGIAATATPARPLRGRIMKSRWNYIGVAILGLMIAFVMAAGAQQLGPTIAVEKTATPESGINGTNITYVITITNTNDTIDTDTVDIEDILPQGITFTGAIPEPDKVVISPIYGTTTLDWTLVDNISPGGFATITVNGYINGDVLGDLVNYVTAQATALIDDTPVTGPEATASAIVIATTPDVNIEDTSMGRHTAEALGQGIATNSVKIKEEQVTV